MNLLEERISEEIKQREEEIAVIKRMLSHTPAPQRDILRKYTIPAFYSLWEGYVKSSFKIYIEEINSLKLRAHELELQLFAYAIDKKYLKNLNNLEDFQQRQECIERVYDEVLQNSRINLPTDEVSTKSNANLKIVNKILLRLNLEKLPEEKFEKRLDEFLKFRNRISHGDMSISITQDHIEKFSLLVIELMGEVLIQISEGYNKETFRRSTVST